MKCHPGAIVEFLMLHLRLDVLYVSRHTVMVDHISAMNVIFHVAIHLIWEEWWIGFIIRIVVIYIEAAEHKGNMYQWFFH